LHGHDRFCVGVLWLLHPFWKHPPSLLNQDDWTSNHSDRLALRSATAIRKSAVVMVNVVAATVAGEAEAALGTVELETEGLLEETEAATAARVIAVAEPADTTGAMVVA